MRKNILVKYILLSLFIFQVTAPFAQSAHNTHNQLISQKQEKTMYSEEKLSPSIQALIESKEFENSLSCNWGNTNNCK